MHRVTIFTSTIVSLVVAVLFAPSAFAAGFALLEQSGSGLGTAFAGTAASAEDASALYFNPASAIHLRGNQFAVALSAVSVSSKFSNSASQPAFGQSLGSGGGDAGGMNWIPSAYFVANFSDRWALGIGVNAPFGLKLEYKDDWMGRFQSRRSEIKTLNLNPALSYRINRVLTFAAGPDYQRIQAELSNAVNYSAAIAQVLQQRFSAGQLTLLQLNTLLAANAGSQGHTVLSGEKWAWGANAGLLLDVSDDLRFGIAYRSPITFHIDGDVTFYAPTAAEPIGASVIAAASATGGPLATGPASVSLKVPGSTTASYWQRLNSRVELLADIAWTQWSSIQELRVVRSSGATLSLTPENWKDTWRAALGVTYALASDWKLRAGAAFDQTMVPDSTRTPRLPDGDRTWLAVGARWTPLEPFSIDFAYSHLFIGDVPLNQNAGNASAYGLLNGTQQNAIDIVSAQVSYRF